jgi:uncharacterized protein (DUF2147 family)
MKNILKPLFFALVCLFSTHFLAAQDIIGNWKTIDDATGEAKSEIQIYQENGKIYGKVVKFLRANADVNRVCDKCTDWRKGQKIMQMMLVRDLTLKGGFYQGGKILDPEKGKEYDCKMWLENGNANTLIVRGFLGLSALGRTQKWYRVK